VASAGVSGRKLSLPVFFLLQRFHVIPGFAAAAHGVAPSIAGVLDLCQLFVVEAAGLH
jgi:hypothetical protein